MGETGIKAVALAALLVVAGLSGCASDGPVRVTSDMAVGDVARGQALTTDLCGGCHAVSRAGASPMDAAPPLRWISRAYPPSDLQEALAEGIITAHPAMPAFTLEAQDAADVIAYLETIQEVSPAR